MVAFTPVLQADLSGTAFGGAPTWTDLTRFARLKASPVTVNAWRQDELSDVAPSTAPIVLDNADVPGDPTAPNAGRFTPDLTTSPFYPQIVPGVRMRLGVTLPLTPTTNLITNPSFENDLNGWAAVGASAPTVTRAVTGSVVGDLYSALITWQTGSNSGGAGFTWTATVVAGTTYTFSISVLSAISAVQLHVYGAGVGASNFFSSSVTGFQRLSVTFTATANGSVNLQIDPPANTLAGATCYVNDAQLEVGNAATDYCDGTRPTCSWTGTPHASTSTRPSSFTFWLIDGQVDSWDADALDGEFPVCTVVVNDILAAFGTTTPLQSLFVEESALDSPLALWPLTEDSGASAGGNISATTQTALAVTASADVSDANASFGNGTGIPTDTAAALTLNTSLTSAAGDDLKGYYLAGGQLPALASTYTFECWLRLDPNLLVATTRHTTSGAPVAVPVATVQDKSGNIVGGLGVWDNNDGKLRLIWLQETNNGQLVTYQFGAVVDLNDGRLHHVAITNDPVNGGKFYVDGSGSGFGTNLGAIAGGGQVVVGGRRPENWLYGQAPLFRGTLEYIAVYATALSAARLSGHYAAGSTGVSGERTDTHVSRLLSYRPNLGATLDVGQGAVGPHLTAGVTLQQALLDTGKAEGGVLYAGGTSKIVLLNRARLRNPLAVVLLDVTAQQTSVDLGVRKDRQQVVNDVTITRAGGATQRVRDAASVTANGPRAKSDTLIVSSDSDALSAAGWLVSNGKTPRSRTPQLTVDLLTEPAVSVAAAVLSLAPFSRVSLVNTPSWLPAGSAMVQGASWTVGVDVLTAAFFTSPLPRPTLRFDATADTFTKLDAGNVWAW